MGRRRGVPALVVVQYLQRLGLTYLMPPVAVDHQIERGAVKEGTRVLDALGVGAFQHPQVGIVRHIFGGLTIAQARGKEAHQFAIVMFHDVT